MVAISVACCVCVLDVALHDRRQNGGETTAAAAADDDEMLADRLLAKLDREHNTNCDVQIGDGMDIGIMGENGRNHLLLIRVGEKVGGYTEESPGLHVSQWWQSQELCGPLLHPTYVKTR